MSAQQQRRDFLISSIVVLLATPAIANAKPASTFFYDDKIEFVKEESQMYTGGKLDLNSAFVVRQLFRLWWTIIIHWDFTNDLSFIHQGDYKIFPGMYPHAAGQIASHGPYASVKDIYNINGLTENDKKLFKKYEKEFIANPPGRSFNERVNSRVST